MTDDYDKLRNVYPDNRAVEDWLNDLPPERSWLHQRCVDFLTACVWGLLGGLFVLVVGILILWPTFLYLGVIQ